ncbi:MAG: hypothetical protein K0S39_490 [Paenibacillus sp.]|jgi:hypothetical protein|nr:hypothetical protein [Paenibacillus sp.]
MSAFVQSPGSESDLVINRLYVIFKRRRIDCGDQNRDRAVRTGQILF